MNLQHLFRPDQAPVINVVAAVLVVLSVVPIYVAQRVSADTAAGAGCSRALRFR